MESKHAKDWEQRCKNVLREEDLDGLFPLFKYKKAFFFKIDFIWFNKQPWAVCKGAAAAKHWQK